MPDGLGGQGPNYFGALAELAKDVGAISAQVVERVTYKELMAQNTEQRRELTAKLDKVEEHVTDNVTQSVAAINARLEALAQRLEVMSQQPVQVRGRGGGFVMGSFTTTVGAAIGITGLILLRAFGISI